VRTKTPLKRRKVKKLVRQSKKASQILQKKPFIEHLEELRSRLFWSTLFLVIGSVIGYFLRDHILRLLISPLNEPLYYSSPAGGFTFTFQISLFFGFIVFMPVFVFQTLRFIEPVIPKKSRFSFAFLLVSACFLMILGMAFAYLISLPTALRFLGGFSSDGIRSLISTNEYLSFVIRYLLGFGIFFQLPLVMIFVNQISPLKFGQMMKLERWVILASFILAAIITPTPDFLNQIMMAAPIILLYQVSVLIVLFINRKRGLTFKSNLV
jgi:sec-independent protein translocase protein TatC